MLFAKIACERLLMRSPIANLIVKIITLVLFLNAAVCLALVLYEMPPRILDHINGVLHGGGDDACIGLGVVAFLGVPISLAYCAAGFLLKRMLPVECRFFRTLGFATGIMSLIALLAFIAFLIY